MACLGNDTVIELVQGRLAGRVFDSSVRHLDECAECRNLVAQAAQELETEPSEPARALPPGTRVGRYRILSPIGVGGMGVVYAAHDPHLDRTIAVKLLRPAAEGAGPASAARLLREARALARVAHPQVVSVYDAGAFEQQVFLAMEHVSGTTLRRWLRVRRRGWREILHVMIEAGRGLSAVHRAGLVHRDFKPDNVLVDEEGRARITDFGLARVAGIGADEPSDPSSSSGVAARLTRSGVLAGTPAYMAPEQLAGGEADAKSDQFAFAVTLYEALSGVRPFAADSVSAMRKRLEEPVPAFPKRAGVPSRVARVVARALKVSPAERYGSMDDLLGALSAAAAHRTARAAIAVLAGIAAIGAAALAWPAIFPGAQRPPPSPRSAPARVVAPPAVEARAVAPPATGTLTILTTSDRATIRVDGRVVATSTGTATVESLVAGPHRVEVSAPSHPPVEEMVSVPAGGAVEVPVRLSRARRATGVGSRRARATRDQDRREAPLDDDAARDPWR